MLLLKFPIINYHKIEERSDFGITARRPRDFENDLRILNEQGFQTIGFDEVRSGMMPQKPIMITFDDGYCSFIDYALPALIKLKMKAVIYIPTNFIGQKNNWDVHIGRFTYRHMDRTQIATVSAAGMEIGSHTSSHRYLNVLEQATLQDELKNSKIILEKITAKDILSVSYPFGRADNRVVAEARKYYPFGVGLKRPRAITAGCENLLLQRVNIYRPDSGQYFMKKLMAAGMGTILWPDRLLQQGAWATIALQKLRRSKY